MRERLLTTGMLALVASIAIAKIFGKRSASIAEVLFGLSPIMLVLVPAAALANILVSGRQRGNMIDLNSCKFAKLTLKISFSYFAFLFAFVILKILEVIPAGGFDDFGVD